MQDDLAAPWNAIRQRSRLLARRGRRSPDTTVETDPQRNPAGRVVVRGNLGDVVQRLSSRLRRQVDATCFLPRIDASSLQPRQRVIERDAARGNAIGEPFGGSSAVGVPERPEGGVNRSLGLGPYHDGTGGKDGD